MNLIEIIYSQEHTNTKNIIHIKNNYCEFNHVSLDTNIKTSKPHVVATAPPPPSR